jgi:hypothetical protein
VGGGNAAIANGARGVLDHASAADQLDAKNSYGDNEQNVNKATQRVRSHQAK